MIGFVTGKVKTIDSEEGEVIIVTSGGVGYLVKFPTEKIGLRAELDLFIYTSVSETKISLWGFDYEHELKLFRMLMSVSGVGPSTAANLVHTLGVAKLIESIVRQQDKDLRVPGVGSKTAQKIIIDLKSKLENSASLFTLLEGTSAKDLNLQLNSNVSEAVMALVTLGYNKLEVEKYFQKNNSEGDVSSLIKQYLSGK